LHTLEEGINAFMESPYFRRSESESVSRTVIDMLFCDRLNNLDDNNSDQKMNWYPEMALSTQSKTGKTIRGRADWCLSHGTNRADMDTTLIVLYVSALQ